MSVVAQPNPVSILRRDFFYATNYTNAHELKTIIISGIICFNPLQLHLNEES